MSVCKSVCGEMKRIPPRELLRRCMFRSTSRQAVWTSPSLYVNVLLIRYPLRAQPNGCLHVPRVWQHQKQSLQINQHHQRQQPEPVNLFLQQHCQWQQEQGKKQHYQQHQYQWQQQYRQLQWYAEQQQQRQHQALKQEVLGKQWDLLQQTSSCSLCSWSSYLWSRYCRCSSSMYKRNNCSTYNASSNERQYKQVQQHEHLLQQTKYNFCTGKSELLQQYQRRFFFLWNVPASVAAVVLPSAAAALKTICNKYNSSSSDSNSDSSSYSNDIREGAKSNNTLDSYTTHNKADTSLWSSDTTSNRSNSSSHGVCGKQLKDARSLSSSALERDNSNETSRGGRSNSGRNSNSSTRISANNSGIKGSDSDSNSSSNCESNSGDILSLPFTSFFQKTFSGEREVDRLLRHAEQKIVGVAAEKYFDVVQDVGRYQDFIPWIRESRLLRPEEYSNNKVFLLQQQQQYRYHAGGDGGREVKVFAAELDVGFGFLSDRYTSVVCVKQPLRSRPVVTRSPAQPRASNHSPLTPGCTPRPTGEAAAIAVAFPDTANDSLVSTDRALISALPRQQQHYLPPSHHQQQHQQGQQLQQQYLPADRLQGVATAATNAPFEISVCAADSKVFKTLETRWSFWPRTCYAEPAAASQLQQTCYVVFSIAFEFRSVLHQNFAAAFLRDVATAVGSCFDKRVFQSLSKGTPLSEAGGPFHSSSSFLNACSVDLPSRVSSNPSSVSLTSSVSASSSASCVTTYPHAVKQQLPGKEAAATAEETDLAAAAETATVALTDTAPVTKAAASTKAPTVTEAASVAKAAASAVAAASTEQWQSQKQQPWKKQQQFHKEQQHLDHQQKQQH